MAQEQPKSIVQAVSAILTKADEETATKGIDSVSFDSTNPVEVGAMLEYCTIQLGALREIVGDLANDIMMLQRQQFPK